MSQISLLEDANSLLFELDFCGNLAERKAPGVMGFKNDIARMKLEAKRLARKAAETEFAYRGQRYRCPKREIDELALEIQRLRNNILFLKSSVDTYKQWSHMDSPCSDRHYSSDSTAAFSPRRDVTGRGTGSRGFSSSQPTLSNSQQSAPSSQYSQPPSQNPQNLYPYFPYISLLSQGSHSSFGLGSSQDSSSVTGECSFKRNYTPRP